MKALALNCTLKSGDKLSSTEKLLEEVLDALQKHGISGETRTTRHS